MYILVSSGFSIALECEWKHCALQSFCCQTNGDRQMNICIFVAILDDNGIGTLLCKPCSSHYAHTHTCITIFPIFLMTLSAPYGSFSAQIAIERSSVWCARLCSMRRSIYRYFMPINEVLHLALDWNARFHHQQSVGKITIIMKWNYRWPRNGWLSNESTRQYEPAKSKRNSLAHHQSSIHLDCSNLNQFKCVQLLINGINPWK